MLSATLQKSTQVVGPNVAKSLKLLERENIKEYFIRNVNKNKVIHAISVDYPETGDNPKTKIEGGYTHGFVAVIHQVYNHHQHLPGDILTYDNNTFEGEWLETVISRPAQWQQKQHEFLAEPVIWKLVDTYREEIDEEF
ncbi:5352_t:CDS:2 [Ambispora leptoticha]|uniref:5352_t:CDS:1 n=1 Tax=Ambispora leptoticha TaxID=144679 RepID=A0A9N8ZPL6_9GLOM|nr:5352_t:CDS:2 [Ambispora leptoticha]